MTSRPLRALVYGDASVDGAEQSMAWAASTGRVLAGAGCDTTLLLAAPVDRVLQPRDEMPLSRVVASPFPVHQTRDARRAIADLDKGARFDVVVVRGIALARLLAGDRRFANRLWVHVPDLPTSVDGMSPALIDDLTVIAKASRLLLCPTEQARAQLETFVPPACGRTLVAAAEADTARLTEQVRELVALAFPVGPAPGRRPLRVLVAGHDFKFFSPILDYLSSLPGVRVRVDRWSTLSTHDERRSRALTRWADVIICEWCGPNAVWYSRNKRPEQRLIVRLHRFELYSGHAEDLAIDAVDRVVCVSPHYARLATERLGWPTDKVGVIPNGVDVWQLDRPKLAQSEWTIGFMGLAPMQRKRFDRALDVLSMLRCRDERFQLAVKTKMPWEYPWVWEEPDEREATRRMLHRIRHDPAVRNAVSFDAFGADVGAWLRRVGFIVSTSEDESFHLAPAEGMASGAVPVIIGWPGADTTYDRRWIHASTQQMADFIHATVESGRWRELGDAARADVQRFRLDRVCEQWADLLTP